MKEIKVLDHGLVRLVDSMGNDLSVVRAARNSYDAAWRAGDDKSGDEKLLRYLWKNRHTTPFEAATVSFEIKAPVFVFRQWHRHRTQSYNEISARYKELPDLFYVPDIDKIGVQSKDNKQMREFGGQLTEEQEENLRYEQGLYKANCQACFENYHELISRGWPRELARGGLPFATYSNMFATMNLLNALKFIELRSHEHAQYEIRVYAEAMLHLLEDLFPVIIKIFREGQ